MTHKLLNKISKIDSAGGDNGGGDSGPPLMRALQEIDRANNHFGLSNCVDHNLNLTIAQPLIAVFGEGNLGKRKYLQKAHCPRDLQNTHEQEEWAGIFEVQQLLDQKVRSDDIDVKELLKTAKAPKAQGNPITTRWNEIDPAALRSQLEGVTLDAVARGVIRRDGAQRKANKIASGFVSLQREPCTQADELTVSYYHRLYGGWAYEEAFKQRGIHSKVSGFACETVITISIILIWRRSTSMQNGKWQTCSRYGFKELTEFLSSIFTADNLNDAMVETQADDKEPEPTYDKEEAKDICERQIYKIENPLELGLKQFEKHFPGWVNGRILICDVGEEGDIDRCVAAILCGIELPPSLIFVYDKLDDEYKEIAIDELRTFILKRCTTLATVQQMPHVVEHLPSLQLIAAGAQHVD